VGGTPVLIDQGDEDNHSGNRQRHTQGESESCDHDSKATAGVQPTDHLEGSRYGRESPQEDRK
jgi:hypothetical protein